MRFGPSQNVLFKKLDDLFGMMSLKSRIISLFRPLKNLNESIEYGYVPPSGLLIHGPSGLVVVPEIILI
jgi:hypothetical protein